MTAIDRRPATTAAIVAHGAAPHDPGKTTEQQRLPAEGRAEGQCPSCGSYRADGLPPVLHHDGCPEVVGPTFGFTPATTPTLTVQWATRQADPAPLPCCDGYTGVPGVSCRCVARVGEL